MFAVAASAWLAGPGVAADSAQAAPAKVLRYAFRSAETGFDPAQTTDLYSAMLQVNIFEAPLTYDYLARPPVLKPQTAAALPEISDDFRRFVFRIRPGIYFADDPAFKGQRRELVAQDYVYAIKRHYDPRFKSGRVSAFENAKILGLSELRQASLKNKTPFDYNREVEGLRALDRYSFEIRLANPSPRFAYWLADGAVTGAVAREVMEAYAGEEMAHPVGTGPYRLVQWRRSSFIVMERNPGFRETYYDEQAPAGDARSQAIAQAFKGRRLPMIDRVEVSIIEELQPRWLAFQNREHDFLERLPEDFAPLVVPQGRLAPNLAKRGITLERVPLVDATFSFFNMEHPLVGGYTPDKVALRRAISLAYSVQGEIAEVRRGQAMPAQGIIPPQLSGHDPLFKSEMSEYDLPRAKALLDLYGYTDHDGDGWRDQPDGRPLVLEYASQPDSQYRQLREQWHKAMTKLGMRIEFKIGKFPEQLKASRAGHLMMWGVAWSGLNPDGQYYLDLMYGPNTGQANHARFKLPAFDALYERLLIIPDGPEREALFEQARMLGVAYMPYKVTAHRIASDLMQPWLHGYRRHPVLREFWRYVDIDNAQLAENAP
jgi:ABC-type transport system substrate-binding protein